MRIAIFYQKPASVRMLCANAPERAACEVLAAESPRAYNSVSAPTHVAPAALAVQRDGRDTWRIELPPHALATVVIRP
ncbi:MAG TPA: hypothetical protein VKE41_22540 [Roseiflexaceae bacterium]|nr:hypothetical protein [Roseiflexaceae bacterium]